MDADIGSSPKKVEQCRICREEDEESNMEAPCFCRGSLKYAHRKCIQRWCNEKGDIVCEICEQLFKPGYAAPSPLFHYGGFPMNFRGNWELSRRDLLNTRFISVGSTDRNLLYPNLDGYSECTSRNLIFCRLVAMTFIILLLLRYILSIIIYGAGEYSISLVMLVVLQRTRNRQVYNFTSTPRPAGFRHFPPHHIQRRKRVVTTTARNTRHPDSMIDPASAELLQCSQIGKKK